MRLKPIIKSTFGRQIEISTKYKRLDFARTVCYIITTGGDKKMTVEQIKQYLKQRLKNIKNNIVIAQEHNDREREGWYTAQYKEVQDILNSIP